MNQDTTAARVRNLSKTYGREGTQVHALHEIDLDITRGQFTAIMGPSGSGKSTLMHIMAGLDAPTSGEVWLGAVQIGGMPDAQLTLVRRRRVGFVFQSFNLVPTLDVRGNLMLPFELDGRRPDVREQAFLDELVVSLGLSDRMTHRPHELSGGQQQRVAIARALVTGPEVVFADEPTGNLDSKTGRDVLGLLRDAATRRGQTIVMVTHDPIAASYADRIVILGDGKLVADRAKSTAEEISSFMLSLEARS
jgi:putative ABC transport system ATP-binding protein